MSTACDWDGIAAAALSRIRDTEIQQQPFPHVELSDFFPTDVYRDLLETLRSSHFIPAEYPGTGRFTVSHGGAPTEAQGPDHHGLILGDWSTAPVLEHFDSFFDGVGFSAALLDKFSQPDSWAGVGPAIPVEKHRWFKRASDHQCNVSLHRDLAHYEISPHADNPAKIVTFLWYLDDDWTDPCGTMLCRPKPAADVDALRNADYEAARRDGRPGLWLSWEQFDVVKTVSGPNVLLAFAPSAMSYHGVKLRPRSGDVPRARTCVRGFIARKGYRDTRPIGAFTHRR